MSDEQRDVPAGVDPETGEVIDEQPVDETSEPQPADDDQGDDEQTADEQQPTGEGRCEAETTAGGTPYRCALETGHDGEHSFQSVEASDDQQLPDGLTEKELAKLNAKVEAENDRHRRRIAEIIGDSAHDLLACPLCSDWIDGKIPPVQPPDEIVAAVKQTLGLAAHDDYAESKHHHICPDCNGLGGVRTGSLVPGNEVVSCLSCNGSGFKLNQPTLAPAGMVAPPNGGSEHVTPTGLNPDDPFVEEARKRGMMVMPLPQIPQFEDVS